MQTESIIRLEANFEKPQTNFRRPKGNASKIEVPNLFPETVGGMKIGMVNMEEDDISDWSSKGEIIPIYFEKVSQFFNWTDLFPEWIDEEEESDVPSCPEIPMPNLAGYEDMDVIVAKLPCNNPEEGWRRDVFRLQVHLIATNLAVKKAKKDWNWKTKVVFHSKCRPMLELFRCDELVRKDGDWWYYEVDVKRLDQKVSLPVGSCKLSLPLWEEGNKKLIDFHFLCFISRKMLEKAGNLKNTATRQVGVEPTTFCLGNRRSIH